MFGAAPFASTPFASQLWQRVPVVVPPTDAPITDDDVALTFLTDDAPALTFQTDDEPALAGVTDDDVDLE